MIHSILYAAALAASHGPPPGAPLVQPWRDGAVYSLEAAPGQLSTITLEPGEKLIAVAAGDTAQWVIGDTLSGAGGDQQSHILVKPTLADLKTNMVVTTDRRVYRLALVSRPRAPYIAIRWTYDAPSLIAVKRPADAVATASYPDPASLNFNYRIEGDDVPWKPLRAFDDGRRTFIQFGPGLVQSEAPPLFLRGSDGRPELVNYRIKGRYYVVDKIFGAAELKLGEKRQRKVMIIRAEPARLSSRRPS